MVYKMTVPKPCSKAHPCELLMIEDEDPVVNVVKEWLDHFDKDRWQVSVCGDLKSAIKLVRSIQFEVILLDLRLHDSSGIETLHLLKKELSQSVPIIVYTGAGSEEIELEALSGGAEFFLMKTKITGPTLVRLIRFAAEGYRASVFWEAHEKQLETELQIMRENLSRLEPSEPMKKLDESIKRLAKIAG